MHKISPPNLMMGCKAFTGASTVAGRGRRSARQRCLCRVFDFDPLPGTLQKRGAAQGVALRLLCACPVIKRALFSLRSYTATPRHPLSCFFSHKLDKGLAPFSGRNPPKTSMLTPRKAFPQSRLRVFSETTPISFP